MSQQLPKLSHHLVDAAMANLMRSVGYLSAAEQERIVDACQFGDKAHIKDKRKSGEPYITHPIAVAEILAGFRLDADAIIAAILHDTVEDTEVTFKQIESQYGVIAARLVDGVTKLKSSNHDKQQNKAATFHKILIATIDDARVLIIKLADRLHNMSTLDAVRPEKQRKTAQETLDFYVPFARLMGLNDIADYIEVLCYRNLNPEMYTKLSDKLLQHGLGRSFQKEQIYHYLITVLNKKLQVQGHVRAIDNKVSMYRQFFRNRGELDTLIRQYTFEIVLESIDECDKLAYYLIQKYQIHDEHIQDNIRRPLPGGNQSLTLIYERENDSIRVIILTKRMQEVARLGVIGVKQAPEVSKSVIQASLRNMKDLVDSEQLNGDSPDIDGSVSIIQELMHYLHARKIICYSPQDKAYELPRGATALDFAYAVGPFIGNIAVGANIDGKPAKLATILKNGQYVEIETDKQAEPKAEWLGFVVTNKARELLRHWFKDLPQADQQRHGEQALDRALQTYDKKLSDINDEEWQDLLDWRGIKDKNILFEQISTGVLLPQLVVSRLFSDDPSTQTNASEDEQNTPQNLIANAKGVELTYARCCNPIYGDPILGHLSRHGLVVHRHKCHQLAKIKDDNPYQIIKLNWRSGDSLSKSQPPEEQIRFPAYLQIQQVLDDEQVSQVIFKLRQLGIGVENVGIGSSNTIVQLIVRSRSHLAQGIRDLRTLLGFPNVMRLYFLQ